jgi:hypothetical protein
VIVLVALFGLAMAFELPRDFVFGPRGDVLPASMWADWIRSSANREQPGIESVLIECLYMARHGPFGKHVFEQDNRLVQDLPSARTIPVLVELAGDDDEKVREFCLSRLAWVQPNAADLVLPVLRNNLLDDDSKCRLHSAHGLWRLSKDRQAIEVLVALSKSQNQNIRISAISFLGEAGKDIPALFDHLAKMVDHNDPVTRMYAMDTMRDFGKQAIPIVKKGFADADARVRYSAFRAAIRLKEDATELLPELRALRCDPDGLVAQEANAKLPAFEREILAKRK